MITGTTLNRDLPQNGAMGNDSGSVLKSSSPPISSPHDTKSHVSRLTFHVSSTPVSRTQVLSELCSLGEQYACRKSGKRSARASAYVERTARYELARAVAGLQLCLGRKLSFDERVTALNAWYDKGKPFMEDKKDKHLAHFLREIDKVKKPIGGDVTFRRMVQTVEKLPAAELPVISAFEDGGPKSFRRAAALHREKAKQARGGVYELSCRDTATALGWEHQTAHALNDVLVELRVIEKAENGAAGKRKGVATKWCYLLPLYPIEVGAMADDDDNLPF